MLALQLLELDSSRLVQLESVGYRGHTRREVILPSTQRFHTVAIDVTVGCTLESLRSLLAFHQATVRSRCRWLHELSVASLGLLLLVDPLKEKERAGCVIYDSTVADSIDIARLGALDLAVVVSNPQHRLLGAALLGAPLFAGLASLLPTLSAVLADPAETLGG